MCRVQIVHQWSGALVSYRSCGSRNKFKLLKTPFSTLQLERPIETPATSKWGKHLTEVRVDWIPCPQEVPPNFSAHVKSLIFSPTDIIYLNTNITTTNRLGVNSVFWAFIEAPLTFVTNFRVVELMKDLPNLFTFVIKNICLHFLLKNTKFWLWNFRLEFTQHLVWGVVQSRDLFWLF